MAKKKVKEKGKQIENFGGGAPFIPGRYDHDGLDIEVEL